MTQPHLLSYLYPFLWAKSCNSPPTKIIKQCHIHWVKRWLTFHHIFQSISTFSIWLYLFLHLNYLFFFFTTSFFVYQHLRPTGQCRFLWKFHLLENMHSMHVCLLAFSFYLKVFLFSLQYSIVMAFRITSPQWRLLLIEDGLEQCFSSSRRWELNC